MKNINNVDSSKEKHNRKKNWLSYYKYAIKLAKEIVKRCIFGVETKTKEEKKKRKNPAGFEGTRVI